MKTAVIYARYSCDSQTEQSIEGQIRVCKQYAANNDMIIVEEYIDRAMSGTNDNRAAFQKMLQDSSKNQFSVVLVYKLDRFSRNKYESVVHKKTLKDHGVKLVSAMENIPDSPEGTLMESLLEGFNQYYSEELAQKINRGLKESWLKGNVTGGKRLFGYDVIDKKCVINEAEAQIIQEIFTKYSQNYTSVAIVQYLKDKGVYKPNGKKFDENYVRFLLHNERYVGRVEHQGVVYTNIYPQIINEALWQQVSAINEINKHSPSHKKDCFNYLLTGKLVCGLCKHKMFGESGTSRTKELHHYYACSARRKKKLPCTLKPIQKQTIEDIVINLTIELLSNKALIHTIAERIFDIHKDIVQDNKTLRLLEQKKTETLKAIKNIVSAIEQGIISEFTKNRLSELENELKQLEYDISVEQHRNYNNLTIEDIENFLQSQITNNVEDINIRKLIVNTLIREVIYYPDKIIITYNFIDPIDTIKLNKEEIEEIEEQCETAPLNNLGSLNQVSLPPQ